jgi:hypothetical protein
MLQTLLQDTRYAQPVAPRSGFALTAVLTLALAIGANAAIFSAVKGVLIAPLPYRDPDRFVRLFEESPRPIVQVAPVLPAATSADDCPPSGIEANARTARNDPDETRKRIMGCSGSCWDCAHAASLGRIACGAPPGPTSCVANVHHERFAAKVRRWSSCVNVSGRRTRVRARKRTWLARAWIEEQRGADRDSGRVDYAVTGGLAVLSVTHPFRHRSMLLA